MRRVATQFWTIATFIGLATIASPATTRGDIINYGASDAYGISTTASLAVGGSVSATATVNATPSVSGVAPPAYSLHNSLASLSTSQGVIVTGTSNLLVENTGLMNVVASSDVDGLAGIHFASGQAEVDHLNANVLNTVGLTGQVISSFFTISATTVTSLSHVNGTFGSLTATGSAPIQDLKIVVNAVTILDLTGTGMVNFAPNTLVTFATPIAGLRVVLNEQILSGNGIGSEKITTNAIHVYFSGVVTPSGTITADLVVAHSSAQLRAVPEPGSLALLGFGGLAMAGYARRHRNKRAS